MAHKGVSKMERKSFEARKAELEALVRAGNAEGLADIYRGGRNWIFDGRDVPANGTMMSQTVEEILQREYPDHPQD
jgi:hypothetical protein